MSFETPERVDLSQDINNQEALNSLTDEERSQLREYLDTEHQKIIYLTQQELWELRGILQEDDSASHDADFDEFIQQQINEWLSSQDIVWNIEGNLLSPEVLESLDNESHNILFEWENAVFHWLDISDTAKDTVSVALTFSLIEDITSNAQLLQSLISGNADIGVLLAENYNDKFWNINAAFSSYFDISGEAFQVPGNGENNAIFMELESGKSFFSDIMSGTVTADNVISKINEANTENILTPDIWDINTLQEIWNFSQEELQALLAAGSDTSPDASAPEAPTLDSETALTALERLREMGGIGAFLATILEFLQWFAGNLNQEEDNSESSTETWAPLSEREIAPQTITRVRDFFSQRANEWIFQWMNRESILALFPEEWELPEAAQNILRVIDAIPGEEDSMETMEHLFIDEVAISDTDATQWNVPRISRFLHDMKSITGTEISIQNSDGTINPSALLTAVNAYRSYRNENVSWRAQEENASLNRNMTYIEFFNQNSQDTGE